VRVVVADGVIEQPGRASPGSGSRSRSHSVNTARTGSSRPANRRSQPRTVSAVRPSATAIRRCPAPAAFATNAAPVTTARSARYSSIATRQQHMRHSATRAPGPARPQPSLPTTHHPPPGHAPNRSAPAHPGRLNSPATSRRSTSAGSVPTVITQVPPHRPDGPPEHSATRRREGRRLPERDHGAAEHDHRQPTPTEHQHILTLNAAGLLTRDHPECRPIPRPA
jgi:hypothetical protein